MPTETDDFEGEMVYCVNCEHPIIPCKGLWGGWMHAGTGRERCGVKVPGVEMPSATPAPPGTPPPAWTGARSPQDPPKLA